MWWWWWAWVALVFIVLVLPWSYGWGRRGWGPPYPTYYRRRLYGRGSVAAAPREYDPATGYPIAEEPPLDDLPERSPNPGWTWLADLLWLAVLAAIGWAIYLWVT